VTGFRVRQSQVCVRFTVTGLGIGLEQVLKLGIGFMVRGLSLWCRARRQGK